MRKPLNDCVRSLATSTLKGFSSGDHTLVLPQQVTRKVTLCLEVECNLHAYPLRRMCVFVGPIRSHVVYSGSQNGQHMTMTGQDAETIK